MRKSHVPTHPNGYHHGLDGVRALAVAAVLVYHGDVTAVPGGFLGVSTFFTLSGFLITGILLRATAPDAERPWLALRSFWARRARRLLPALGLALGLASAYIVSAGSGPADGFRGDLLSSLVYVTNWRFVLEGLSYGDLFADPSPLAHLWSLAIEEQFYVLFPLVVLALRRRRRSTVVGALTLGLAVSVASTASWYDGGAGLTRAYYGTDTRAAELLVGALLAVAWSVPARERSPGPWHRRAWTTAGLAGLTVTLAMYATVDLADAWLYQGGLLLLAVASAGVVGSVVAGVGPLATVLGVTPLRQLGRISYGVYLFHWPLYLWLDKGSTGLDGWMLLAARLLATLAVATASYHLVELPVREGNLVRGRTPYVALPAVAGVLALTALLATGGAPDIELETNDAAPAAATTLDLTVLPIGDGAAEALAGALDGRIWSTGRVTTPPAVALGCGCAPDSPDVAVVAVNVWDWRSWMAADADAPDPTGPGADEWLRGHLGEHLRQLVGPDTPIVITPVAAGRPAEVAAAMARLDAALAGVAADDPGVRWIPPELTEPAWPGPDAAASPEATSWADARADELLPDLTAAALRARGWAPRLMVVGDSVAVTVGHGLEDWGLATGRADVWNAAHSGCGLVRGGQVRSLYQGPQPADPACEGIHDTWREQVDRFDPDVVVVLTTFLDLRDRQLDGWPGLVGPGTPEFDEHMLSEYRTAATTLAAEGAAVVWLTAPCVRDEGADLVMGPPSHGEAFGEARRAHLNTVILPELADDTPLDVLAFDDGVCPGGAFTGELFGIDDARPDGVHFSTTASRAMAAWLGPELLVTAGLG